MPASEAHLDAPRALRRVRHAEAFNDSIAGVVFVGGVAQSGMPESVFARLRGIGLPLIDLGPWEAAPPASEPVAAPPPDAPALAALPTEPAPPDAPALSPAHAAPPASSPSVPRHGPPQRRR